MKFHHIPLSLIAITACSFILPACTQNYYLVDKNALDKSVLDKGMLDKGKVTQHVMADSTDAQATPDKTHHTTKDKHVEHTWSYEGKLGPKFWGDNKKYGECKLGDEQSPINISQATAETTKIPNIHYNRSASIAIKDNGHTIVYTPQYTPEVGDNSIKINGQTYELKQFHYHAPSEHQLSGKHYPAEFHFVHANQAGELAVIGVMLEPEDTKLNQALHALLTGTSIAVDNNISTLVNEIDIASLIPHTPDFYHYGGSLTTPPCSENVQWFVAKQPLPVAESQIAALHELYKGNNRPIQPHNDRKFRQLTH